MLRIIEGGFSSVAYEEIKEEIFELTSRGERVFLLTPEQQSVIAEQEIIGILPESAPLCFEVTNFTRLANTVYRRLGGIASEYADSGKEALIMWKTLTELSPFLRITGGGEVNTGMVEKALSAVAEMKSISAHADELAALCDDERIKTSARLISKLSDISKIMTLYTRLLEEKYSSARDECERLAAKLAENTDFFADSHIFVTGFTSFTEPQIKVLTELMRGSNLTVHLTLSKLTYDFFEFSEIKKTKEQLLAAADKHSVKKLLLHRDAIKPQANPLIDEAVGLLWRSFGSIDNSNLQSHGESIRIFEAADPYEECDFIAADIKKRVLAGCAWRDFAIVARNAEKYDGIIDSAFDAADIPYFISKRKDISSYEAIKLIYTAFATVMGEFVREDVISYAKCGLSGISANACDEFELYTDMWQINKARFTDGIYWNMSPDGYDGKRSDKSTARLARINETRAALIDPLIKFGENLNEAKTVREYATVLVNFLTDISLEEKIENRIRELSALGEHSAAEENGRLWQTVCNALDSIVEVLGDTEISTRGFLNQLKVILSEVDLGKIPAFYDEVTVGSADMIRLSDKKHIYLIGVNQGEFPSSASVPSYFTDKDKETLSALGIMTDPDSKIPLARELFFFSRAFAAAKESVTLLYSVRNEAFASSAKADVIDRLKNISNGNIVPVKISEIPHVEKIYYPKMALDLVEKKEVRDALVEAGYARDVEVSSGKITNSALRLGESAQKRLYPDNIALTQSRIDSYVDCPFAYYLRYNIRLSEGERAEFNARNIGTFIHAILENFFQELRESGEQVADISAEKRQSMVERAAKKYLSDTVNEKDGTKKRTSILLDRLCRSAMPVVDGLCDELKDSSFVPSFFELKIGGDDENLPRPATFTADGGKSVSVYGAIDRVDTYKSGEDVYVRVIDYKTGSKTFAPTDIDEGKNLQMFLYLKAIVDTDNSAFREKLGVGDGGDIIPAGVIYVKTDMSDVTVNHSDEEAAIEAVKKKQARRGMILDDAESISAMNKDYIPVRFKKDGTPDSRSEKFLYTREGWGELSEKISDKVLDISKRMRDGDITLTQNDKKSPCEYCKFKPVCRKR